MKKFIIWLLCAAMVLSLCACGAKEEEAPETEAAGEVDAEAMAAYEAAMKAYEEALATLEFPGRRNVLRQAHAFITEILYKNSL